MAESLEEHSKNGSRQGIKNFAFTFLKNLVGRAMGDETFYGDGLDTDRGFFFFFFNFVTYMYNKRLDVLEINSFE